jgi:hypothetical protein
MNDILRLSALTCATIVLGLGLSACGSDTTSSSTAGTGDTTNVGAVNGDVPLAYVKRATTLMANPTDGTSSANGGDLMLREKSSPSAPEYNLTSGFTQSLGDASDPEVSYDGKKIVFAMRCPTANNAKITSIPNACTGRWNIWEYDMTVGGFKGGTFRRITSSASNDDVDPAYLPGGRGFVFSSNRQATSKANQSLGPTGGYTALDEYEREAVINLHTMDANGGNIQQISVNQSHDRNPVVRADGSIMFSRWDHVGGRNHFKVFTVKPDGTGMFVVYGAHSSGNSFLHPREMDPKGAYKGQLSSDLMPLSRTHEGGALVFVDAANYSEQNTPSNSTAPGTGGQRQATSTALSFGGGLSLNGRVTTPYPVWDGTDRVLVAYRPCEVTRNGVVIPCANLTTAEKARLGEERMAAEAEADAVQDNAPPVYSIYMFNPANQTMLPVATPPAGFMYTDPVALQARTEPASLPLTASADVGTGIINVQSVYDTDGLGRMGDPVLTAADLAPGCTTAIAKIAPTAANDLRPLVADLVSLKDPAKAAYRCAPARFIRVVRAIAPPGGMTGVRSAIGETEFEQQQILGYAPIEPDGSVKISVPANTPLGLAVIDSEGRAFQTHSSWLQVRAGETVTCKGCHSPRRAEASINSGSVLSTKPAALLSAMSARLTGSNTMADARAGVTPPPLAQDLVFSDVWADTAQTGITARPNISLLYSDLATPAPSNGLINYPEHIQPLWSRDRGANTCTTCHNASAKIDLSATTAGTGRVTSYEKIMLGDPVLDTTTGLPVIQIREGVPEIERGPALVDNMASEGQALGLARKSRLMEILSGQSLMSDAASRTAHPTPTNHANILNAAEKRLIAEWMDLGGQYYNNPYSSGANVRAYNGLSKATFDTAIRPILQSTCAASCHQAVGSTATPAGTSFRNNHFVLTGSDEGDYNVTLSMISDACNPASNYLLSRPSAAPGALNNTHPSRGTPPAAILPLSGSNYTTIANWIATGCVR